MIDFGLTIFSVLLLPLLSQGEVHDWGCVHGVCYTYDTTLQLWGEAKHSCEQRGMQLLTVENSQKHQDISDIMTRRTADIVLNDVWLGIYLDYAPLSGTDCWYATKYPQGFVRAAKDDCTATKDYICMRRLAEESCFPGAESDISCDANTVTHTPVTYDEARQRCEQEDEGVEEFKMGFVGNLYVSNHTQQFADDVRLAPDNSWVVYSTWTWVTGEELSYSSYDQDYPMRLGFRCMQMFTNTADHGWKVVVCDKERNRSPSICQYAAGSSGTSRLPTIQTPPPFYVTTTTPEGGGEAGPDPHNRTSGNDSELSQNILIIIVVCVAVLFLTVCVVVVTMLCMRRQNRGDIETRNTYNHHIEQQTDVSSTAPGKDAFDPQGTTTSKDNLYINEEAAHKENLYATPHMAR